MYSFSPSLGTFPTLGRNLLSFSSAFQPSIRTTHRLRLTMVGNLVHPSSWDHVNCMQRHLVCPHILMQPLQPHSPESAFNMPGNACNQHRIGTNILPTPSGSTVSDSLSVSLVVLHQHSIHWHILNCCTYTYVLFSSHN